MHSRDFSFHDEFVEIYNFIKNLNKVEIHHFIMNLSSLIPPAKKLLSTNNILHQYTCMLEFRSSYYLGLKKEFLERRFELPDYYDNGKFILVTKCIKNKPSINGAWIQYSAQTDESG